MKKWMIFLSIFITAVLPFAVMFTDDPDNPDTITVDQGHDGLYPSLTGKYVILTFTDHSTIEGFILGSEVDQLVIELLGGEVKLILTEDIYQVQILGENRPPIFPNATPTPSPSPTPTPTPDPTPSPTPTCPGNPCYPPPIIIYPPHPHPHPGPCQGPGDWHKPGHGGHPCNGTGNGPGGSPGNGNNGNSGNNGGNNVGCLTCNTSLNWQELMELNPRKWTGGLHPAAENLTTDQRMQVFMDRRFNVGAAVAINTVAGFGIGSLAQGDYGNGFVSMFTELSGIAMIIPSMTILCSATADNCEEMRVLRWGLFSTGVSMILFGRLWGAISPFKNQYNANLQRMLGLDESANFQPNITFVPERTPDGEFKARGELGLTIRF